MKQPALLLGPVIALLIQSCAQQPTVGGTCSPAEGKAGVSCWYKMVDSGAGEQVLKCVYKNTYTHTHSHKKTHTHNNNTHTGSGTYSEGHTHSANSACQ